MLQATVISAISSHLGCSPEDVGLDMRLDALGIDSLGAITIMYKLEDQLDVEIPNEVFDSLEVVSDIVNQLDRLLKNTSTK